MDCLLILSIPRTGSNFICNVIDNFQEFEFFFEVFHHKKVFIRPKRKSEIVRYISSVCQNNNFRISGDRINEKELVELAHADPGLFFNAIKNTKKNKYFGFKVFRNHLSIKEIDSLFIRDKSIFKLILKRNLLDAYASDRIASTISKYVRAGTSNIQVEFEEGHFLKWLKNTQRYYKTLEDYSRLFPDSFANLTYEEINQFNNNGEKICFIADYLRNCGFDLSLKQDLKNIDLPNKQDMRKNTFERFKNPDDLKRSLYKHQLQYLLY